MVKQKAKLPDRPIQMSLRLGLIGSGGRAEVACCRNAGRGRWVEGGRSPPWGGTHGSDYCHRRPPYLTLRSLKNGRRGHNLADFAPGAFISGRFEL